MATHTRARTNGRPRRSDVGHAGMYSFVVSLCVCLRVCVCVCVTQHLQDMEDETTAHEGCHLTADMRVRRVAGRVYVSMHQQMVFQMLPQVSQTPLAHTHTHTQTHTCTHTEVEACAAKVCTGAKQSDDVRNTVCVSVCVCLQLLNGHHVPHLLNMSHIINHVSFGPHYPGQVNPLDGFERILDTNLASFKYFLKVSHTHTHMLTHIQTS